MVKEDIELLSLLVLKVIPAIIDNEYKENTLIKQLIENIQRESLTNDEISNAIKHYIIKKKCL